MRRKAQTGFLIPVSDIRNDIFIPRYYDPRIEEDLAALLADFDLMTLGDLVAAGHLRHDHGDYVPKLNYGTGPYPYIRTSDISNWELRASPKHGVAKDVLDEYSAEQDVRPDDILVVHEGTYLIGTAAFVTAYDGPMLYTT
jgi:type I restriction enzyme M protein